MVVLKCDEFGDLSLLFTQVNGKNMPNVRSGNFFNAFVFHTRATIKQKN